MTKPSKDESKCCFKTLLKTIDSLDMQINRIKNQLTELRLMIGEEEVKNEIIHLESDV